MVPKRVKKQQKTVFSTAADPKLNKIQLKDFANLDPDPKILQRKKDCVFQIFLHLRKTFKAFNKLKQTFKEL